MLYLIFVIGAIFGSFYSLVGTRLPEERSIVKPGSHCEKCGHVLKWYENIPILSYILLGGLCKKCKEPIGSIYFLINSILSVTLASKIDAIETTIFLSTLT